ncbi:hypothetical protein, partial [Actinotignum urinale]
MTYHNITHRDSLSRMERTSVEERYEKGCGERKGKFMENNFLSPHPVNYTIWIVKFGVVGYAGDPIPLVVTGNQTMRRKHADLPRTLKTNLVFNDYGSIVFYHIIG